MLVCLLRLFTRFTRSRQGLLIFILHAIAVRSFFIGVRLFVPVRNSFCNLDMWSLLQPIFIRKCDGKNGCISSLLSVNLLVFYLSISNIYHIGNFIKRHLKNDNICQFSSMGQSDTYSQVIISLSFVVPTNVVEYSFVILKIHLMRLGNTFLIQTNESKLLEIQKLRLNE